MLDNLRDKADKLINESDDELSIKKYKVIKEILSNDKCFLEMDAETAISILVDLHISFEDAKKIYVALINEENYII